MFHVKHKKLNCITHSMDNLTSIFLLIYLSVFTILVNNVKQL